MNPRRVADTENRPENRGSAEGPVRVVLLGRTGVEAELRGDDGIETVIARTPLEAVGEVASPPASSVSRPTVVLVGPGGEPSRQAGAFLSAIRDADPSALLVRVGRDDSGNEAMYDAVVDAASGDTIREMVRPSANRLDLVDRERGAVHEPRLDTLEPPPVEPDSLAGGEIPPTGVASQSETTSTQAPEVVVTRRHSVGGAPVSAGGEAEAGDVRLLSLMGESRSVFEDAALDVLRGRLGDPEVRILSGESAAGAGAAVVPVVVAGEQIGGLCSPRSDHGALKPHADWLGAWLTHFERHRALRRAAFTDPLTGAWNRRYFDKFLNAALERARAQRRTVTVLVFDIDGFKQYNDRFGHPAGDEILIETVRALRSSVRPSDRVCRIGGDEFAVIFDEPEGPRAPGSRPPESVYVLACRVQKKIAEKKFPKLGADAPGPLTISGGLAAFPWDGHDATTLIAKADELACLSKRQGKNAITLGPGAERVCRCDEKK